MLLAYYDQPRVHHYYLNGDDLACEADDDTTYLGGTNLTLDSTTFNVDDPFTVTNLITTDLSATTTLDYWFANTTSGLNATTTLDLDTFNVVSASTTDSLYIGGYASSTVGFNTSGSMHIGTDLTVEGTLT